MANWIGTGGSNPGDVATSGKLGIGTTNPAQNIHIHSASNYPMLIVESTHQSGGGGDVMLKGVSGQWEMYVEGSSLRFYNSDDRVTISTDGKVGVGTTSPAEQLDVNGGIKVGFCNSVNAGTIRWNSSESKLQVYTGTRWENLH